MPYFSSAFDQTGHNGVLTFGISHEMLEAGPVPEELDVAHALSSRAFKVLERNAL